ncbi:hypothetical protein Ahu01nite_072690 [Winogradskya humida]|uniref:Uncharacterized protein n=1 Tax=Winogradskya humida TaxID=113566 RepID=A0ABQ4A001_9ACTN|nr:hypothetical protein Ahu01nite_072690 [Actinoplanes humidus]
MDLRTAPPPTEARHPPPSTRVTPGFVARWAWSVDAQYGRGSPAVHFLRRSDLRIEDNLRRVTEGPEPATHSMNAP